MSEDRLLQDLARLAAAREAQGPGSVWERLAAGELTPLEVEQLRREAAASPEAAAAWEAFRPLDDDFRAALVARLKSPKPAAPARVVAPRRAPAWLRFGLVPALAAACLLVFVQPWNRATDLPAYELTLLGASRGERSPVAPNPGATSAFARGNRFDLLLTPATSAGTAVEARAFALRGERLEALTLPHTARSDDGALRFAGIVGEDVLLPEGESTLLIVVGRPGRLPDAGELRARLAAGSPARDAHWSAWSLRVRALLGP